MTLTALNAETTMLTAARAIERIAITSREQWLGLRADDVTASAAGALLGVHPYISHYALWATKSGRINDDAEETPAMRRGRLLEPVAVQMLREDRPEWKFAYPHGQYYRDPVARIGATPDLVFHDKNYRLGVAQIKSVENSIFRKQWRNDAGDVEPPLWIVIQAIIEASLTGAEIAFVAAMTVGFGVELHIIPIPLHAGIMERLKKEVAAFWARVESGTPPDPDHGRDGAILAQMFPRDDGTEIDLHSDNEMPGLVDQLLAARLEAKDAKGREDTAKAGIAAKMKEHTFACIADGRRISFKRQESAGYTVGPKSYRVLRVMGEPK